MYDDPGFGKWSLVRLTVELRDELERTEMALKELELAQKASNDDKKTNINQSKELINALDKIQSLSQRGV